MRKLEKDKKDKKERYEVKESLKKIEEEEKEEWSKQRWRWSSSVGGKRVRNDAKEWIILT